MARRPINLVGHKFGQMTVIAQSSQRTKSGGYMWECLCECGTKKIISTGNINYGEVLSCGCTRYERTSESLKIHGMTYTPEYRAWCQMKGRCRNKNGPRFTVYGGRGIDVCDRWANSFETFLKDMGPRPPRHSLDRIDNDKGYSPENCRWADNKTQQRNRSGNRRITAFGQTMCLAEWAEKFGIRSGIIGVRIKLGWTPERAVSEPSRGKPRT